MSVAAMTDTVRLVRRRQQRAAVWLAALAGALAVVLLLSIGIGAVGIAPGHALAILLQQIGLPPAAPFSEQEQVVLLTIRLPRAVLAVLVGAGLAACGATLQGLFHNPLADPALLGVSSGAALAAAAAIVFGGAVATHIPAALLPHFLPLAAFGGGLLATCLVYTIASRGGATDVATMLLAGVAMNAVTMAGIGLLIFLSSDRELRDLNYWMLGSLGGVTWAKLMPVLPLIAGALAVLLCFARPLNALLLGEAEAQHLGFRVERVKRGIIGLTTLATGAAVALTGVIGFVGLVVPHLVRLVIGPDNRALLPASMMLGAILLLVADLIARIVALPAEIPIGIVTSFIGTPVFLWLLLTQRHAGLR
jgi:iron complex transport system permease protein